MGKEIVVFIHGHMGSAKQFGAIVSKLRDVDHICLTLPGHETDVNGFLKTDGTDWQGHVTASLDRLRQEYDDMILVGHSMGGLLSINAAISCPEKIKAIVAIALPLRIKITLRGILIRVRALSKQTPTEKEEVSAARTLNGVRGITARNAFRLWPNLAELFRIMRHTRRSLPALTVPLVVMHSRNDEIVSGKSPALARKALPSAGIVELVRSSHFWFPEEDVESIVGIINAMLNGNPSEFAANQA